ncbi:MAG TPA: hypothetical protein VG870_01895, partial [Chitinophagaceae bacterium]|nr:hypothetical protein [Chitinophagaceae bacterium]
AYALQYLPYVDCLPFRKGNNLAEQMKIPAGALPDSFAIRFIYAKNGREYEFSPADLPADLGTYTFRKRIDKLVRKGNAEPAIKGFSLTGSTDTDSTPVILQDPYCLLLFDEAFDQPVSGWIHQSGQLREAARQRHIPLYIATTARDEALEKLRGTPLQDLPVFNCDFTVIRMAARTTPCLYLLQAGTVVDKWGPRQFDKALARVNQLAALSAAANQGTPGQPAPSNP